MNFLHLIISLVAFGSAQVFAMQDDFRNLVEAIAGEYTIVTAGGETPKEEVDTGSIEINKGDAEFAFPYCPKGAVYCESGFHRLPFAETKIDQVVTTERQTIHRFSFKNKAFQWVRRGERTFFRYLNHPKPDGTVGVLEYELKK